MLDSNVVQEAIADLYAKQNKQQKQIEALQTALGATAGALVVLCAKLFF